MSLLKVNEVTDLGGDTPAGVGKILQVVSTAKLDPFTSTTASYTAVTGLSATITPTSASSKILIISQIVTGLDISSACSFRVSGGNATTYIGNADGSRTRGVYGMHGGLGISANKESETPSFSIVYLDSPNTTSSTTYQIEMFVGAGTCAVNRVIGRDDNVANVTRGASSITLMEVAG